MTAPMRWELFCRVIDNHGDVGVCWRLGADLAARGEQVRLWIDDASALRWMAPHGATGVQVRGWPTDADADAVDSADVVIEAFGCELPEGVLRRMAAMPCPPIWINLEYLSAEDYVERSHRLASPQSVGAAAGLRKTFFYPGFTPRTGGLLREPGLCERQTRFDRDAWLNALGLRHMPGEQIVSLFCYEQAALSTLLDHLAARPTLLLATDGHATRQVTTLLGPRMQRGRLRARVLPLLTQTAYDELLWASDLNFVRGEDSFVRAQWAGKPFVWQAYPQDDGVQAVKVDAFLTRFLHGATPAVAAPLRRFWSAWNDPTVPLPDLPDMPDWTAHCQAWRDALAAQDDLVTQLSRFASGSR